MDLNSSTNIKYLNQNRTKAAITFMSVLFLILFSRLWYLQIFQGKNLKSFSERNSIKERKIYAPRGQILDRNGKVITGNLPGYRVSLEPRSFRRKNRKRLETIVDLTAKILDDDPTVLLKKVKQNFRKTGNFLPALVAEDVTLIEALKLKQSRIDFPEVRVEEVVYRDYPLEKSGAQLLGYVSLASKKQIKSSQEAKSGLSLGDHVGQTGLEKALDNQLRGVNGISYVQVDARGRVQNAENGLVSYMGLKRVEPFIGNSVVLTLDRDIQNAAYRSFEREDKYGLRKGGLIALNMKGEVLAWVSRPSFNPALFQTGISPEEWKKLNEDPFKPLTDKVAQGTYPPGSVFKPFMALAALHLGEIDKNTRLDSPGYIVVGKRPYHDSRAGGHGFLNVAEALEVSGNVFFYKLGMRLGVDKLSSVISKLGLGEYTGIPLIPESKGILPTSEWKKKRFGIDWQYGENLHYAIGQGAVDVTVLQLAKAYLTIASKGKVYRPFVVKEILSHDGSSIQTYEPELVEDLTSEESLGVKIEHFESVIEGLARVAHGSRGTARYRSSKKFLMAGKTGTAQVRGFSSSQIYVKCESRPESDRHHGLFVGFAPAKDPEIVVAGLALHACHGSSGAAPMVTDVLTAYMKKHHPEVFTEKKVAVIKEENKSAVE